MSIFISWSHINSISYFFCPTTLIGNLIQSLTYLIEIWFLVYLWLIYTIFVVAVVPATFFNVEVSFLLKHISVFGEQSCLLSMFILLMASFAKIDTVFHQILSVLVWSNLPCEGKNKLCQQNDIYFVIPLGTLCVICQSFCFFLFTFASHRWFTANSSLLLPTVVT